MKTYVAKYGKQVTEIGPELSEESLVRAAFALKQEPEEVTAEILTEEVPSEE